MSEEGKDNEEVMKTEEVKEEESSNENAGKLEGEITPEDSDHPQEKDVEVGELAEEDGKDLNDQFEVKIDQAIINKLSAGFLQKFLPTLERSKSSLDEVLSNQKILIETVEQENAKFTECQAMEELTQTMQKARQYYNKLIVIKKDMNNLHDKSAKLKKRAVKLQQQRQKEELQKAQQREKEMENERRLAARVAKPTES